MNKTNIFENISPVTQVQKPTACGSILILAEAGFRKQYLMIAVELPSAALCHAIGQTTNPPDLDVHHIADSEAECIRRHDAGSGQQDGPCGKRRFPAQLINQLLGRAFHLSEIG